MLHRLVFLLSFVLASCVNGQLDPRVAPFVAALDVAACAVADVFVADRRVGAVCQGALPLVNGILSGLSVPALPLLRAPGGLAVRVPIHHKGVTIGHVDADIAAALQAKLDAQ